ncbi:MAG: hypothetical protein M0P22_00015 [Methanoculleus sp.]|nr:hypothetical protein [Methanoculleus sp.]
MRPWLPAVLLTLVVALVFLCGCLSEEPHNIVKSYNYALSIKTNTPIENVTLLVPIPMRGDWLAIGPVPLSDAFYADRLSERYTLAVVPVDGRYYLRVTAPFMDPAEPVGMIFHNHTFLAGDFRLEIVPQLINTLHPFGNESLFLPKQNLTLTAGSPEAVRTSGYNPDGYRYSYTIPVYAYYENGTRVEISSRIWGANQWSEGFDYHPSNQYSDAYSLAITSEPRGWMSAEGEVTAGRGVYEEWQLAPSPTTGLRE